MKQITLVFFLVSITIISFGQWQSDENNIFFNSGNVGIGTNNPMVKFDISDSTDSDRTFIKLENKSLSSFSTVNLRLLAGQNGSFTSLSHLSETYTGSPNQADFGQLWTNGAGLLLRANGGILRFETSEEGATTERMRINKEGNVGIGVANPGYKLDIDGDINITSGHNLLIDGTPLNIGNLWNKNELDNLYTYNNVGIGLSIPEVKLDISDSTETERTFIKLNNKSLSNRSSVNIRLLAGENGSFTSLSHLSETYTGSPNQADFGQLWTNGAGLLLRANGGILRFETSEEGASIERMRIDIDGNIGINTNQPKEKLEVNGNILIKDNNALILTSPNGTEFKITVDDNGNLTTSQVAITELDMEDVSLTIYPNPTENTLTVNIDDNAIQIVNAEIYDISGKLIFMKTYNSSFFTIDTKGLNNGNYILKLKSGDGKIIKTEKFIKN